MTEEGAAFRSYVDGREHPPEPGKEHRDAERHRQRHHDGARSVHPVDLGSGRARGRRWSYAPLGRAQLWRRAAKRRSRCSESSRARVSRSSGARARRTSCIGPFDGYAIGGLAVGEDEGRARGFLRAHGGAAAPGSPALPDGRRHADRSARSRAPRRRHVRLHPADRSRQQGTAFTSRGVWSSGAESTNSTMDRSMRLAACPTCHRYSRAYLHHLVKAGEGLGWHLIGQHNFHFYHQLMGEMREASSRTASPSIASPAGRIWPCWTPGKPVEAPAPRPRARGAPGRLRRLRAASGSIRGLRRRPPRDGHGRRPGGGRGAAHRRPGAARRAGGGDARDRGPGPRPRPPRHGGRARGRGLGQRASWCALRRVRVVSTATDLDPFRLALRHVSRFPHLQHGAAHIVLRDGCWESKKAPLSSGASPLRPGGWSSSVGARSWHVACSF